MSRVDQPLKSVNEEELLKRCSEEPIHLIGSVQAYGALIASDLEWNITHASENCRTFVGLDPSLIIDQSLRNVLGPEINHLILGAFQNFLATNAPQHIFSQKPANIDQYIDLTVYGSKTNVIIEIEIHDPALPQNTVGTVKTLKSYLHNTKTLWDLIDTAARMLKMISGYHRVMVYRFLDDESGEVISEQRESFMEAYKGMRFPASDIPQQARKLYTKNLLRQISDVDGANYQIVTGNNHITKTIDLSLSGCRSVSEIHLVYLRNMKVKSSLSISIVIDGKLWGLFALHHRKPRYLSLSVRTSLELFAEIFSLEVSRLQHHEFHQNYCSSSDQLKRIFEEFSDSLPLDKNLELSLPALMTIFGADGASIYAGRTITSTGTCLDNADNRMLLDTITHQEDKRIVCSNNIFRFMNTQEPSDIKVAGFLALAINHSRRHYLFLFRKPVAKKVIWAGEPHKAATLTDNGLQLQPRSSFKKWIEEYTNQSESWSSLDWQLAELLRNMILDLIVCHARPELFPNSGSTEHQQLMISELQHRARNTFSLIQAILRQTRLSATDMDSAFTNLESRIQALTATHAGLTGSDTRPASLEKIISREFEIISPDSRIKIIPPEHNIILADNSADIVAMFFHELTMNAIKHGALRFADAELTISWTVIDDNSLKIKWQESGLPRLDITGGSGFGLNLIRDRIPALLDGEINIEHQETKLSIQLVIAVEHFSIENRKPSHQIIPQLSQSPTQPSRGKPDIQSVLILEDDPVLALDYERMLRDLKIKTVHTARNSKDAYLILAENIPDFAFLDIQLDDGNSFHIARKLLSCSVPFVFLTGYGNDSALPTDMREVKIMEKPVSVKAICKMLDNLYGWTYA